MTPDCCKKCDQLMADGNCLGQNKKCVRWLVWFTEEWASIRRAAERIKKEREAKK